VHRRGRTHPLRRRLHQFPRQSGIQRSVNPGAVGWSAHLDDNPTFTDIFMDRDPASWQEMAIMWRAGLAGSSIDTEYMPATVGTGGISISLPTATSPPFSISELWYTAPPGATVAQFYVTGTTFGLNNNWLHGFVPLNTQVPTGSVLNPPAGVFNGLVSENAVTRSKYLVYRLYSNGVAASQGQGAARRSRRSACPPRPSRCARGPSRTRRARRRRAARRLRVGRHQARRHREGAADHVRRDDRSRRRRSRSRISCSLTRPPSRR
jgi:hypothetical protein